MYYVVSKNRSTGEKWTWIKITAVMEELYPSGTITQRTSSYVGDYMTLTHENQTIRVELNKYPDMGHRVKNQDISKNSFLVDMKIKDERLIKAMKLTECEAAPTMS